MGVQVETQHRLLVTQNSFLKEVKFSVMLKRNYSSVALDRIVGNEENQ